MKQTKEITALFKLIDDPDDLVFDTVSEKIIRFGKDIIPHLENLWEHAADEILQERIEHLIHRVQFEDLQKDIFEWSHSKRPELLKGAILIARYQFSELNVPALLAQFDLIRRNIWLELNNYLTPLEQINVLNSILYNYYKIEGQELTKREAKHFFINQVLESKQGNNYAIGILYLALCEMLDIPVFAMNIPRQFVFAYIDTLHHFFTSDYDQQQIQFFVDPLNGMVYTQTDVNAYLKKINCEILPEYFTPLPAKTIIYKMMEELAICYQYNNEEEKAAEIKILMKILEPHIA